MFLYQQSYHSHIFYISDWLFLHDKNWRIQISKFLYINKMFRCYVLKIWFKMLVSPQSISIRVDGIFYRATELLATPRIQTTLTTIVIKLRILPKICSQCIDNYLLYSFISLLKNDGFWNNALLIKKLVIYGHIFLRAFSFKLCLCQNKWL